MSYTRVLTKLAQSVAIAGLAVGIASSSLSAQHPQARKGFWIGAGLGYGSLGITDGTGREGGLSGYLKLGGTLKPNVLLGVESSGWTKDQGGVRLTSGVFAGTVTWYPSVAGGFFVKGGPGVSVLSVSDGVTKVSETGFGVLAGGGYDLRVGSNISITPALNYTWGKFSDGKANNMQLALGVTFH